MTTTAKIRETEDSAWMELTLRQVNGEWAWFDADGNDCCVSGNTYADAVESAWQAWPVNLFEGERR